jgi:hypothetical protein
MRCPKLSTPLHAWVGLLQRLVCAVWFGCVIALALRHHALATAAARLDAEDDLRRRRVA